MSNYRKTMSDALREMYPLTEETQLDEGTIDKVKEIASKKQAMKIDGVMVDSFTASAISQIYDKVNDANKKKMEKLPITKLANLAMKMMQKNEFVPEEVELDEAEAGIKVHAGPDHDRKVKRIQSLAKQLGAKVTNVGKSTDGKMSTIHVKGSMKVVNDLMKLRTEEVDLDEAMPDYNEKGVDKEIEKSGIKKGSKEAKLIHRLLKGRGGSKKEEVELDEGKQKPYVSSDSDGKHVMGASGKIVKSFKDMDSANAYLKKNYNKLMKEEVDLDEALSSKDQKAIEDYVSKFMSKMTPDLKAKMEKDPKAAAAVLAKMAMNTEGLDEFTKKDFDSNEDQNMHTENAVELARKFGTSKEYDQMVAIYKAHMKKGEISRSDQMKRDALVKKYLPKLKEEVDLDEAKSDFEVKYAKSKGGPIKVTKFVQYDQARKFLHNLKKDGMNGIISKDGKPVKEEVDLDEGKMSQLHQYIKDKKSAEEIAKLMKLDVKTVKALMNSHHPEEVEESAASDARRAMRRDKDFSRRDSADDDTDASDDDVKGASKNIMMQMRKAQSLSGNFAVEFADKKKVKIPAKMAIAVQQKYNAMKKPADKEKFQARIGKSYKDMLSALKEELQPKKESILERMNRKIKENKDG